MCLGTLYQSITHKLFFRKIKLAIDILTQCTYNILLHIQNLSKDKMKRVVVDIDDTLHREFKTYCYSTGKTMRQVILAFMESKTKKKGGMPTKKKK